MIEKEMDSIIQEFEKFKRQGVSKCRIPKELRKEIIDVIRQAGTYTKVWSEWGRMKFDYFSLDSEVNYEDFKNRICHFFPAIKEVKFYKTKTLSHDALMIRTTY